MPLDTDSAAQLAVDVARSLLEPERVTAAVPRQAAATLCDGLAGTALLHACLSPLDAAFATAADRHWQAAAQLSGETPPAGIHTGPGGLAASLIIGTPYLPDSGPYDEAVRRAVAWLSARAEGLAHHQQRRSEAGQPGAPWAVYDAISGLTGIGRVLLAAGHHTVAEPGLTAALTTLTQLLNTTHRHRPGWWLPANAHPPSIPVHPSGAATTGLAHGVAGPLALLALAHEAGHTVPGQPQAIRTAASWLLDRQESAATWPPFVTGDELTAPPSQRRDAATAGRRDAWCYGSPGIGRALTLAGKALNDPSVSHAGRQAIASITDRSPNEWDAEGPTLCHGAAGILLVAARSNNESVARLAADHIANSRNQKRPFAFPHIEIGSRYDNPGLLTGAAGVALTLADHGRLLPPGTYARWDSTLLTT